MTLGHSYFQSDTTQCIFRSFWDRNSETSKPQWVRQVAQIQWINFEILGVSVNSRVNSSLSVNSRIFSSFLHPLSQHTLGDITNHREMGAPGWLSRLRIWLLISTQVMISGPWIEPPVWLCAGCGACLRFSLSLAVFLIIPTYSNPPPTHSCVHKHTRCSFSLKKKGKKRKKFIEKQSLFRILYYQA